jgi:ESF2/ABP1 family protein
MAKAAAALLNGQPVVAKKGSFYSNDLWTLKYLPRFTWAMLMDRLAYNTRMRRERLRLEARNQDE